MILSFLPVILTVETSKTGFGKSVLFFIALYFVVKWAVKNGIREAYEEANEDKYPEEFLNFSEEKPSKEKSEEK